MRQQGAVGWFKHDITNRGITAWILSGLFFAYYIILYWGGQKIFGINVPNYFADLVKWTGFDWANKWHFYGLCYSLAILIGGIYVMWKYKHNRYQIVRTSVVIFVQFTLAFSIPIFMEIAGNREFYFSYLWPLKIEYMYPRTLSSFPIYIILYSMFASFVIVPILSILYGKRWYCSWVCGCGGLANTFGEPWRHLSSKTKRSWTFEKFSVHAVLVLSFVVTLLVAASFMLGTKSPELNEAARTLQGWYGFWVVALLSGIVGVGLYPIGGTRVWCRFFCPMAALIGLTQKFGRFRITVKENMCISCGLCSKYCEMGIDVRAYAQRNQSFVRASCVGCGLCAEVCPRGVLRLENKIDRDPQELTMSGLLSKSYREDPHRKAL